MVFYFSPDGHDESKPNEWLIYMGKDKFENEDLIKHGWPEDVWFHVDNLSSAHVYLRLPKGATLDDIPPKTLEDCCQLVKANSIEGCKHNNVDIVYTFWSNLKKTQSMDVGQVGFHNQKAVKKYRVDKKDNDILKRINKTKVELYPDLAAERERYDKEQAAINKKKLQEQKLEEKKRIKEKQEQADLRSYKGLMDEEKMLTNTEIASKYKNAEEFEDDFM